MTQSQCQTYKKWTEIKFFQVVSSAQLLEFFDFFWDISDQKSYVEEFAMDILPFIFQSLCHELEDVSLDIPSYWSSLESKALDTCRQILALSSPREFILCIHSALEALNHQFVNDHLDDNNTRLHSFPERQLAFLLLLGLDALAQIHSNKKHLFYEDFLSYSNQLFPRLQTLSLSFPLLAFFEKSLEATWIYLLRDHEAKPLFFSFLNDLLTLSEKPCPIPDYLHLLLDQSIHTLKNKINEFPLLVASLSLSSMGLKNDSIYLLLNTLFRSNSPIHWHYALLFLQKHPVIDLLPVLTSLAHCISVLCWENRLRVVLFKDIFSKWLHHLLPDDLKAVLVQILLEYPYWNLIHACIPFLSKLKDPNDLFFSLIQRLKSHAADNEAQKVWDSIYLTALHCKHKMNVRNLQYLASSDDLCANDDLLAKYHLEQLRLYLSTL